MHEIQDTVKGNQDWATREFASCNAQTLNLQVIMDSAGGGGMWDWIGAAAGAPRALGGDSRRAVARCGERSGGWCASRFATVAVVRDRRRGAVQ